MITLRAGQTHNVSLDGDMDITEASADSVTAWYLSGGIASAVTAYTLKGAASQAASYVNLANPGTYDLAPGVAPTWDTTNGLIFNGTNQYLTTGIVPDISGPAWSYFARYTNFTAGSDMLIGVANATHGMYIRPTTGGGATVHYFHGQGAALIGPSHLTGTLAIAGLNGYRDGVFDVAIPAAAIGSLVIPIFVAAYNANGSPSNYGAFYLQYLSVYNTTITAPQVAALHAATV